jgi:hypothetical protein
MYRDYFRPEYKPLCRHTDTSQEHKREVQIHWIRLPMHLQKQKNVV